MSEPPRRSTRTNKGKNPSAKWVAQETTETKKSPAPKKRKVAPKDQQVIADKDNDGEVLCVCGATTADPEDERPMAECEKCLKWQHVVCMIGVNDESQLPEPYLCQVCQPRKALKSTHQEELELTDVKVTNGANGADKSEPKTSALNVNADAVPKGSGFDDKVRESVFTALSRIFSRELVPMAISEHILPFDTNVSEYADQLALDIEESLYRHLAMKGRGVKDVGKDYRGQFRMLAFNLKDGKNHDLQLRIVARKMDPKECATLSSEQMLSPEIQKLAESVRQESIRESVLKMDEAPRVRKTHKGEEIVEEASDAEHERDQSQSPGQTSLPNETTIAHNDKETHPNVSPRHERESSSSAAQKPQTSRRGEAMHDNGAQFDDGAFSPMSDNDQFGVSGEDYDSPAQTFGVSDDSEDGLPDKELEKVPVWAGQLVMASVADLSATAYHVGGDKVAPSIWPAAFDVSMPMVVDGRLAIKTAVSYLHQMSQKRAIGSFILVPDEEGDASAQYKHLFDYFKSRNKVGVLPNHSGIVKDAYIIPLSKAEPVPEYLQLDSVGAESMKTMFTEEAGLLGVYVLPTAEILNNIQST